MLNMVLTRSVKRTADWPTPLRAAQVVTTVFGAPIWGDAAVREAISQSISVLADEMMLTYEWIAIVSCSRLASSVGDRPFPINMMSISDVDERREDKSSRYFSA